MTLIKPVSILVLVFIGLASGALQMGIASPAHAEPAATSAVNEY